MTKKKKRVKEAEGLISPDQAMVEEFAATNQAASEHLTFSGMNVYVYDGWEMLVNKTSVADISVRQKAMCAFDDAGHRHRLANNSEPVGLIASSVYYETEEGVENHWQDFMDVVRAWCNSTGCLAAMVGHPRQKHGDSVCFPHIALLYTTDTDSPIDLDDALALYGLTRYKKTR